MELDREPCRTPYGQPYAVRDGAVGRAARWPAPPRQRLRPRRSARHDAHLQGRRTREPGLFARALVDRGYTKHYDVALQALQEIPYGTWRQYDPEDAVRFYALRLHEIGMLKSSPQKLIAQGTDWRFLHELKKELKG
jgi:hypothetical protein